MSARFPQTRWSLVSRTREGTSDPQREAALDELCREYYQPLFLFVRSYGYSPEDAEDLTQDFFARLLRYQSLESTDPSKGRLRTFLLRCLKNHLASEYQKTQTAKRDASLEPIIDDETLPSSSRTPDRSFDRNWALALIEKALAQLTSEFESSGRGHMIEALLPFLSWNEATRSYQDLATELNCTPGAIKVAVHRMRKRFATILRDIIAETLPDHGDCEDEIQTLTLALDLP